MISEPDDATLLAMSASGSADAFDRFVARHQAAVFRYLRTKADDADAEDALQQTFVAAWRNAATIQVRESARPPWWDGAACGANIHREGGRSRAG